MKNKKDILKNARVGTRIYNSETNTHYVKTDKGTWQKDDQLGSQIRSTLTRWPNTYHNTISESGEFNYEKKGFTITNDHPLAEKLRSSEKVRVEVRDKRIDTRNKLAIKRKEEEEASILSKEKANINKILTGLQSGETVNIQGSFYKAKDSNQEQTQKYITEYQEKLKELDTPKPKKINESVVKPERSSFYFTDKYEKDNDVPPTVKKEIDQGKADLQKLFGVQL